ncbi:hypothetical protein LOZ80_11305 [Paenibacillus sp. HWE-109]|uniref:hypothetical protein n=1 Tax=Paenibacillus sp. HWE-109 TaxID=1306526 RepID=UPI001EDCC4D5|nr:hypothetical protein [Paenibacillus sp. HWE-109]UKS29478.1 hypothetical protein LOZ80_11305 [Paenibacillus sp. HWE-109]
MKFALTIKFSITALFCCNQGNKERPHRIISEVALFVLCCCLWWIGIGVLFSGTVSVVLFGFGGGVLVDKLGNVFTMLVGLLMIGASFLCVLLFPDRTPWLISLSMVLTFGGLAFVKTVVSTSVAGTLDSEESGSGMGFLNFACFLGEGIGVAAVGSLLTKPWLAFPLLPTVTVDAAFHYSNLMLIFIAALVMGTIGFLSCNKAAFRAALQYLS